jgi:hypothetical protein
MRFNWTLKLVRLFGVLVAIFWLLLPFADFKHQSWKLIDILAFCVGILTLVPFSRLQRRVVFGFVFLLYAVAVIAFIGAAFALHGWGHFFDSPESDMNVLSLIVLYSFVVLLIQLPCIFISRRESHAVA